MWSGIRAQNILAAEKEWKKEMKAVIRQEDGERQNESTGVNRARSGGTLGEGRHFSAFWEETGICQMGFVN